MPRLEACYFVTESDAQNRWERMASVLLSTAQRHCPDWTIHVERITPIRVPDANRHPPLHVANTQKLERWWDVVQASQDGDQILLMDVDLIITRPLDPIWELPFDLAYGVRKFLHLTLNAGMVALRISPQIRLFMERWVDANRYLIGMSSYTPKDKAIAQFEHSSWRHKFGGMNQAALGKILHEHYKPKTDHGLQIRTLPCLEWNCEDSAWLQFDPNLTRIVHVKGRLRKALFRETARPAPEYATLVKLWRDEEQRAQTAQAREAADGFDPPHA